MTVQEFATNNGLEIVTQGDVSRTISGCYIGDLLSLAMSRVEEGQLWITIQGNVNIAAVAALTEPAAILLAEGRRADEETLLRASQQGITILYSDKTAYELACLLYEQSR
ncbi:MAG: hypothetical protein E7402_02785 [Ruminococcaceae bacterium]|nr:hypothetical protein [Oscillospiraceae bacterium]